MNGGAQDPPLSKRGQEWFLKLHEALGISSGDVVAFVGAGGKSGAILAVAGELTRAGMKVLAAPTTKMLLSEAEKIGPLVTAENDGDLRAKTEEALVGAPGVVVGGGMLSKNRVGGLEPERVSDLARWPTWSSIEADGSRRRPIKGTAEHEPAIPDGATLVVAVATSTPSARPSTKSTSIAPRSSPTLPVSARARA
jgi:molybdenum cofactor cytidylyltransferase